MKAAIVDAGDEIYPIATESGAEGINLQFALAWNFDLPWNPQRVERHWPLSSLSVRRSMFWVNLLNHQNEANVFMSFLKATSFRRCL